MESFETYRPTLFGLACRMLGSAMEAEDVLQEAYLRTRDLPEATVQSPKAYQSKIVTHLCLDHLKSARVQREEYVGTWLPEPVLTSEIAGRGEMELDALSMAFLILMENLSPAERAVFLLHEVFDYSYAELSDIVGKDEAACRQLLHRAKKHVAENSPRFKTSPQAHEALLGRFMTAVSVGDLDGLMNLLAEDVVSTADGGGKTAAARMPLSGREKVARVIVGIVQHSASPFTAELASINSQPGLIVRTDGQVLAVVLFEADDQLIHRVRFVVNPDKLNLASVQV